MIQKVVNEGTPLKFTCIEPLLNQKELNEDRIVE